MNMQKKGNDAYAKDLFSATAADLHAVVICGSTDLGIMAEIGRIRSRKGYKFPLVGIAPEARVTWPSGRAA